MSRLIKIIIVISIILNSSFGLLTQKIDYFGQKPPGNKPEVFAPNIISTEDQEFYISFSDDGNLCVFIRVSANSSKDKIKYTVKKNGKWSKMKNVPYYNLKMQDSYYILDSKGKDLYFSSKRPFPGTTKKSKYSKLWKLKYENETWSQPQLVDLLNNQDYSIGHSSFTKDGSVFFYSDARTGSLDQADIFYSRLKNGRYGKVQNPGPGVNTTANECDPFISSDEKYMLIATSKHPECLSDDFDIFISFKNKDNSWSRAVNLGKEINSTAREIYPRISPDGKYIFFSSNRSGNWDIYWVDTTIIEKLKPVEAIDSALYVLAYDSDISGNPEIYLTDIEGKKKKKITDYKLRDGYAVCSPDGKKIAFYAYYNGHKTWSIHTMNLDGSDRKRLTKKTNVWDSSPDWSPDQKQIIFTRKENKTYKLWIMSSDGSNQHQLDITSGLDSSFTPDGRVIFSNHWDKTGEIFTVDVNGKNLVQLTDNKFSDGHPKVSKDGKKVVFFSKRDGNRELYLMNIDGTNQVRLTNSPGDDWNPAWSPDDSKIAFISNRDGDYEIFVFNSDGSDLKKITDNKNADTGPTWLTGLSKKK